MIKENMPLVEEVRELVSEENKKLTPEQKKENQKYILANLDKYIIDVHGNFFHTDEDMLVNEDERLYIGKEAVEDCDKIREGMVEVIIREKENWEIVNGVNYRKKDSSGAIMFSAGFSFEQNEQIKQSLEGESRSQNF